MKENKSLRLQTIVTCVSLILGTFLLTGVHVLAGDIRRGNVQLGYDLNLTADKKMLELDTSFMATENAVTASLEYILRTIDENRILRDEQYEKEYMDSLKKEMSTLAGLSKDVMTLYFRMNIERFGGMRGIFMEGSPQKGFISIQPTDISKYSATDTEHVGWYYEPIWAKRPIWTSPYENKNIGVHMISYIAPVYRKGELLGVVGMDVRLAMIKNIIDDLPIDNELCLLLGKNNGVVYYNNAYSVVGGDVEESADVSAIFDRFSDIENTQVKTFRWKSLVHWGVRRQLANDMTLVLGVSENAMKATFVQIVSPLAISFVIAVILTVVLLAIALLRIIMPIRLISEATHKLSHGELGITIPYHSKNELGRLSDNIRMMTSQMQEYIDHIRAQAKKERSAKEAALAASQSKTEFLAAMYISLHEIDLTENTLKQVQSRGEEESTEQPVIPNADMILQQILQKTAEKDSWDTLLPFADLSTLQSRMKNHITIAQEFAGFGGIWCRARFIVMDKNADGTLRHVLWAVEDINDEYAAREKLRLEAEQSKAEIAAKNEFLASLYHSLHEIDLNTDTFLEISSRADVKKVIGDSWKNARATVRRVMEERVQNQGQARKDFMDFINFETLDERLKDKITVAQEFYSVMGYWCRARFIVEDRNPDGSLHHVLYAVENINEEREERERLQGEVARSIAASQAKSAFLANMSHEIRTPINAVLGMDEMILRECEDDTILGYAANIKTAGSSLLAIINDILDFSKIEAGKMELIPENYDISSVIVDLVNMISERAKKKNLAFKLEANPRLPKTLYGDSVRIKQCILNLLTNAVKYTQQGSITFSIDFTETDHNLIKLKVRVEDTGSGIKKEDMEKLFSPFERIEEDKNKTIEGTGLGMSIVKKMLSMMNTQLEVESEYGKGSVFHFDVDQTVVDWTAVGDINETYRQSVLTMEKYTEKLHAPKARMLFVDDTEMNLEVIKGLLKKTGIKLDTVLSGKLALEKVRENCYDILFIDHRMPEMDGIQTLHAMQTMDGNKSAGKPCIALTANAIAGVKQMYLDEGFTDYLSKPVDPVKLEAMIRKYLPPELIEVREPQQDENAAGAGTESEEDALLEKLRAVDGLDSGAALANCGTPEVLVMSIGKYYATIDEKAEELTALLAKGDMENYGTKVHALKSTSRLIGLTELASLAEHLEHTADAALSEDAERAENARAEIQEKHPPLMKKLAGVKEALAPFAAPDSGGADSATADLPELSTDELKERMARLLALADDFDIDGLDALIAELSAAHLPADFTETFKGIRTCVENVDFNALKTLLTDAGFSA